MGLASLMGMRFRCFHQRFLRFMLTSVCVVLVRFPIAAYGAEPGQLVDFTIYYTPIQSGFTSGKGFDLTPETRPGLEGRTYPADFLRAVRMEGHGRLSQPYRGFRYIYYNGQWGYTDAPRGTRAHKLVPKQSCAVSMASRALRTGTWLRLDDDQVPKELAGRWQVVDVGGGVGCSQIDLYWGEDKPKGTGAKLYQPAGTTFTGKRRVPLEVLAEQTVDESPTLVMQ